MSKFRAPPPPGAPPKADDKVIPFPSSGEMTPERQRAELAAFERAASAELMLRMRYDVLKAQLKLIDSYEPVPDDCRAKLMARPSPGGAGPEEEDDLEDIYEPLRHILCWMTKGGCRAFSTSMWFTLKRNF